MANADPSTHLPKTEKRRKHILSLAVQGVPADYQLIMRQQGEEPGARKVAITGLAIVGAIALYVAQGVLQKLGGYIFDAIFPFFKAAQQRELVELLAQRLRQVLDEVRVRQANGRLSALLNLMADYNGQQGNATFRLEAATIEVQFLVSELEEIGLQALDAYLVAAGLQLAVVQELYFNPATSDDGEKQTAVRHVQNASAHVLRMIGDLNTWNQGRFLGPAAAAPPGGPTIYYFTMDGVWYAGDLLPENAATLR
jgi:hypothetical protein